MVAVLASRFWPSRRYAARSGNVLSIQTVGTMANSVDFWFNATMLGFSALAIMFAGLDMKLLAGLCGLLSEPGYGWIAYKSKSWGLAILTVWWTYWWAVLLITGV